MSESWNDIFGGQFATRDLKIFKVDNTITEHTPIMCNGRVVGHTVGENKIGYPVECVLYSQSLFKEEMIDIDDTHRIVSMEIRID